MIVYIDRQDYFLLLMEKFGVINQVAVDECLDGRIDVAQVSHHGLNVEAAHAFICAHAHSAADDHFTIRDNLSHIDVLLM